MTDDLRNRPPSHLPIAGGTIWRNVCVDGIQRCNAELTELKKQRAKEDNPTAQAWLADRIISTLEVRDVLETLLNYFQDQKRSDIDALIESTRDLAKWNRHLAQLLTPDNEELDEQVRNLIEKGQGRT